MKIIKIKKNGKIFLEESAGEVVRVEKLKTLKEYLGCEVEFEQGLTFGTLFNLILKEKDIFDIIFCQELNGKKLEEFEKKLNEPLKNYEEDFKLEYLEVSKIFELFIYGKGSTIDLFSVFVGMGKTNDGFQVFIPLSFFSVSELKDLEIKVDVLTSPEPVDNIYLLDAKKYGVIFIPAHLVEELVLTSEVTALRDEFGHQRLREKKYLPGQIDSNWSEEIKNDFLNWLNNYPNKLPMTKKELDDYLKERNF